MHDILINPYFKNIAVPMGTAILTILIKSVSKEHGQKLIEKRDLAIGLDLCVTSLAVFATGMVDLLGKYSNSEFMKISRAMAKSTKGQSLNAQDISRNFLEFDKLQDKLAVSWWMVLGLSLGTFSIAFLVRQYGWGKQSEIGIWIGVVLPNIVGIVSLIGVVTWIGS